MALGDDVLCHFWYYPDSYDTWMSKDKVDEEADLPPRRGKPPLLALPLASCPAVSAFCLTRFTTRQTNTW